MSVDVRREHANIDILLRDSLNKLVVVVENKVGSKEHNQQLSKYREFALNTHPNYVFVGIFLTPQGDQPSDKAYLSFTYERVRELVFEVLERESVLLTSNVRAVLEQYADLLGRRFMADKELKKLCTNIYRKHRQALEILLANAPDDREELATELRDLIDKEGFFLDDSNNNYVRFMPKDLDIVAFQGSD